MSDQHGDERNIASGHHNNANNTVLNGTVDHHNDKQNGKLSGTAGHSDDEKNGHRPVSSVVDKKEMAHQPANGNPATASKDGAEKKSKQPSVKRVGFFALFRFADGLDIFLMLAGSVFSIAAGAANPTVIYYYGSVITQLVVHQQVQGLNATIIQELKNSVNSSSYVCFSELINSLGNSASSSNASTSNSSMQSHPKLLDTVYPDIVAFTIIAAIVLICSYLGMSLWVLTSERQVLKVRMAFFQAVMRQDIGWFDMHKPRELNTRMVDDVNRLHEGLGDKMATFLQWMTMFFGGYILSLVQSWKLALVVIATTPLLIASGAVMGRVVRTFVIKELQAYARAGSIATEMLTAVRTLTAFGGQAKAIQKYESNLGLARAEGIKKSAIAGVAQGIIWFFRFATIALTFWYGGKLVREECLNAGIVLEVFFGVLVAGTSLGQAVPLFENFSNARGAATALFEVIDEPTAMDRSSDKGLKPESLNGDIEYENIDFSYPARKDVQVMRGLSLKIKAGQTVALVGPSGCGKSTLIQLLQRFYDPLHGTVKVDGVNIKELNLSWLRGHVGVVGQEPLLFNTTIEENIRLGGTSVTNADIERVAKEANCYDFISKLPQKFKTLVGERGAQLSGGQKQRIAIARAIVGNPRILLLDEATSALDTESEAIVQAALDKAGEGRTTIVVAHRLSTVRHANVIYALREGTVAESGTHSELMEKEGLYYSLNALQQKQQKKNVEKDIIGSEVSPTHVLNGSINVPAGSSKPSLPESEIRHQSLPGHGDVAEEKEEVEDEKKAFEAHFTRFDVLRASLRSLRDVMSVPSSTTASFYAENSQNTATEEIIQDKTEDPQPYSPMLRVFRLNMPEILYIVIGSIGALLAGAVQPVFAIILSEVFGVFGFSLHPDEQADKIAFWSWIIVVIGICAAAVVVLQCIMFGVSGERLTQRLRQLSFSAMLKQEMGWFDEQKNQVGALTARLAMDASTVKGAIGSRLSVVIQSSACIITAIVVSYVAVWQLALVFTFMFPITIAGGIIQGRVLESYAVGDKASIEEGGKIAQEAITNIRTVAGLNKEAYFVKTLSDHFNKIYGREVTKAFLYGLAYAFSQCIFYFSLAICYSFGAYLVDTQEIKFYYVLRVFGSIVIGGQYVGTIAASSPDYTKAKIAASKLISLLDRKPKIDSSDTTGIQLENCEGNIKFSNVAFRYPTRQTVPILHDLTVEVSRGERLALVGSSGCGKSTAVTLLERFYDPQSGAVTLDGHTLQSLNIQSLRHHFGLVSQEPILFDTTIAENIAYGDNTRLVPMQEVIDAAKKANIHDFITSLPLGYDTNVGDKGTQLSGGQKQRIAIARALVRNPRILLLDEATSALDTESEKVVQEALDRAQEGRTCIVIAHRLSTVTNATKIAVIHNGQIAEIGTHNELIAAKKHYFHLVNAQTA